MSKMTHDEIVDSFRQADALLTGHFKLRSGLHSCNFFQCALVLRKPLLAERLCATLAENLKDLGAECVISPAVGGLIVGQEIARALKIDAIFADKENDMLVLKRGFSIQPGTKVIVAEDVVTKGGRVQQTIDLVRKHGGIPVAVAVIADRSSSDPGFGIPFYSLVKLNLPTYDPDSCPLCKEGKPLETPGSGAKS